jgi:hypothetical protein
MQDLLQPPPPIQAREKLTLKPSFLRALQGAWLLTWKNRLSWGRMPALTIALLVLPLMVYLTTSSRKSWIPRQTWLGNPLAEVTALNVRLGRTGLELRPEQKAQLTRIFIEEYARTETSLGEIPSSEAATDRRTAAVKNCYERIRERANPILAERQLSQIRTLEQRKLIEIEGGKNQLRWSRTTPFHQWLINFYFFVILPLSCVASCGSLIREELQANTLPFLTTRPLTRAALVAVKFISQTAWLQILVLLQALLLFAAGALREVPGLMSLLPLFLATQFLATLAWSALGTLLGLVNRRFMAIALLYGFVVEMGIGRIPTNINSLSMMRHLKSLLARNSILQDMFEWPTRSVPFSISALLLAAGVFLALALLLFTFKEYHPTTEMQK